jgi:formylglycine-generating enzyme required for sulfatase activity
LSHSSVNNAEAVALRDWLAREGWKDEVFLDLDPTRGIAAGERWERKLNEAANRCEAVLFLISKAWIFSEWCRRELNLAHRLNKRLFGVLIEDLPITDVPRDLTGDWQLVRLASGRDHVMLNAVIPVTQEEVHVTFSSEGLQRLKHGLEQAGLDPKYFSWPPAHDPDRPPYRGLKPLEADDAGIFFGRDAPVVEALDKLRGLREAAAPRLLVILGASGAGKSSFLRAGLLPRLKRDDRNFLPVPIIRPERAALYGETGLLPALEAAFSAANIPLKRSDLRVAIEAGAGKLRVLLKALIDKATPSALDVKLKRPTLVISIDQGEELFLAEGQDEAQALLALLRDLAREDSPELIVLFTIRSDSYERLQQSNPIAEVRKTPFDLSPMPKGAYAEVIKGPARRLVETGRSLKIDDALVDALLADIEEGGGKDALPLLAFTLERLYVECGGDGRLILADYEALGRIKGSIEAAVERAFKEADKDPAIPKDRNARLSLLRRGLIPWLAGIDPETGNPRRRVARKSEIPEEARPLIQHLVDERLLATDVSKETGEQTIEPVHEALLRQWGLLQGWLAEDTGLLGVLQGVERASLDWAANGKSSAWLTHRTNRLKAAEHLLRERPDLASKFEPTDRAYLAACRRRETTMRMRAVAGVLGVAVVVGLGVLGLARSEDLMLRWDVWRNVLSAGAEQSAQPKQEFRECSRCPVMVVVPAGEFLMGSPDAEKGRDKDEGPQHKVTIAKRFAVGKFELTFDEWQVCVASRGCGQISDSGWGSGNRPVMNVSWDDAMLYVAWLSRMTGKSYRLLTEAEWEYAARGQTAITAESTPYAFGNDAAKLGDYAWYRINSNGTTQDVGKKLPNAFGLHDMHGNVKEWVEDCYAENYNGALADGSTRAGGDCSARVLRGGSWSSIPGFLRSAARDRSDAALRDQIFGFRVARTLITP